MHGPMSWGEGLPMGHGGSAHEMKIPLIPAPAAFCTMMLGFVIGLMIGRRKGMMHGMGAGMMHGMGPGMGCGGDWSDWAEHKHMVGDLSEHHHHGDGLPACVCGCDAADVGERAEGD